MTNATLPLTTAEAKLYLRLDGSEDDAVVMMLIDAATDHVQNEINQQLVPATLSITIDAFPNAREIRLPRPPLRSVEAIRYFNPNGTEQVMPSSSFDVDEISKPGRIVLKPGVSWPATDGRPGAITIEFDAGPTSDQPVPASLRQAIRFFVGQWFEHREGATDRRITEVPFAVRAILDNHRFVEAI